MSRESTTEQKFK